MRSSEHLNPRILHPSWIVHSASLGGNGNGTGLEDADHVST
jgi:hypothetical protein